MSVELSARFWAKVERTPECWLWTAGTTTNGYGRTYWQSANWLAHRLAYTAEHGPIPDGLQLDHLCRVRRCVRPDHLRLVTPAQNSAHRGDRGHGHSGIRNVYWHRRAGKWMVQVTARGRTHYGGLFVDQGAADAKARTMRAELFGDLVGVGSAL